MTDDMRLALEKMLQEFGSREHEDCKCDACNIVRNARAALLATNPTSPVVGVEDAGLAGARAIGHRRTSSLAQFSWADRHDTSQPLRAASPVSLEPRASDAAALIARSDKYLNTGSGEYASEIMRDMAEFIRRGEPQALPTLDSIQFVALLEILEECADYVPAELNARINNVLEYHADHDTASSLPRPHHSTTENIGE